MLTHRFDSTRVEPGDLLAGKYRVDRLIGSGGMGQVLVATHEQLGQRVAIKVMRRGLADDGPLAERFRREARAAAKLTSEHVVRVFDVDELPDGTPFIVMEYLEGSPLSAIIAGQAPLPVPDAIDITLQALEGVAEAHAAGIVHRDLKPENLFVGRMTNGTRVVKVLDFGISKVTDDVRRSGYGESQLTVAEAVLGTPAYMSPEQVESARDVDGRSDLWSLGVILRELLTGKRPFDGESPASIYAKILRDPLPVAREVRPDLPVELDAVLERCLARNRDRRFSSAGEMAAALMPFLDASPSAAVGAYATMKSAGPEPVSGDTTEVDAPVRRVRPGGLVYAGFLVAGGVAALLLLGRPRDEGNPQGSAPSEPTPASRTEVDADTVTRDDPTAVPSPSASGAGVARVESAAAGGSSTATPRAPLASPLPARPASSPSSAPTSTASAPLQENDLEVDSRL